MRRRLPSVVLLTPALLASCVAPPVQGPPPRPVPVTIAPPPVIAPPAAQPGVFAPGSWTYATEPHSSTARFGTTPQTTIFSIQCDRMLRSISLLVARPGATDGSVAGSSVTLRASTMVKAFPGEGGGAFAVVRVPVRDPILDALAFSRGRFTVAIDGVERALAAWPEFTRVVEDCRA